MIAYDLFAGAGGATCGLRDAGYDVHAFERWDVAADTHDANHDRPTHRVDLMDRVPAGPAPDLLWASPPCQPFSAAGDQLGEFDDRDCMPGFIRAVEHHLPPVVVMENVKGLTFEKHWLYLDTVVIDQLRMLGYDPQWRVLDCADYGVPQNRERFVLIARRDGGRIVWPMPTHTQGDSLFLQPWVSMADALGWGMTARPYPTIACSRSTGGPDKEKVGGSGARASLYEEQAAGRWVLNPGRTESQPNRRQRELDEPAPTVAFGHDSASWVFERPATTVQGDPRLHPPGPKVNQADIDAGRGDQYEGRAGENAIRLTLEQAARLQDFPDGYVFTGNKTERFTQVGNAVPRTLARVLAEANR